MQCNKLYFEAGLNMGFGEGVSEHIVKRKSSRGPVKIQDPKSKIQSQNPKSKIQSPDWTGETLKCTGPPKPHTPPTPPQTFQALLEGLPPSVIPFWKPLMTPN